MKYIKWVAVLMTVIFLFYSQSTKADFRTEEDYTVSLGDSLTHSIVIVNDSIGHGTGFYISPHEVITDEHVIHGASNITVMGKYSQPCPASVYYADSNLDLALLDTKCEGTPLKLADRVKVGQTTVMMGNPDDQQFFLSKGIVSNISPYFVGFDAITFQGDSGAPLVNLNSEVLGVARFVYIASPRAALATSDNTLRQFIAMVKHLKSKE